MILIKNDMYIVINDFFPINKKNVTSKLKMLNEAVERATQLKKRIKKAPYNKGQKQKY